jgi:hypothetical protein
LKSLEGFQVGRLKVAKKGILMDYSFASESHLIGMLCLSDAFHMLSSYSSVGGLAGSKVGKFIGYCNKMTINDYK